MNNDDIYKKASNLLDKYFQQDMMGETIVNEEGNFAFGQPQQQSKFSF